ncbi:MAG: hypothetical protein KA230_10635 [Flavobacteriales bacterium]|nr:hypothetical protein [Flavobacteriales bacterium]
MTYLYVFIGVLAFLAVRNILAVRRSAKRYADGVSRELHQPTDQRGR